MCKRKLLLFYGDRVNLAPQHRVDARAILALFTQPGTSFFCSTLYGQQFEEHICIHRPCSSDYVVRHQMFHAISYCRFQQPNFTQSPMNHHIILWLLHYIHSCGLFTTQAKAVSLWARHSTLTLCLSGFSYSPCRRVTGGEVRLHSGFSYIRNQCPILEAILCCPLFN